MENGLDVRYRISDLQSGMCRWIACDTSFAQEYCGHATHNKSNWCKTHYEICYAKKRDAMASVSNQHQPTMESRPRPSIHIGGLRSMDFKCRQRIPPAETGDSERAD